MNEEIISVVKQLEPPTQSKIFSDVLRNVENIRALEFRKFNKIPKKCPICLLSTNFLKIEVDHIKKFSTIRDEFIKFCNEEYVEIPSSFDEDSECKKIFKEEDEEFKLFWIDYQPDNNFQYLCKNCNRKKG